MVRGRRGAARGATRGAAQTSGARRAMATRSRSAGEDRSDETPRPTNLRPSADVASAPCMRARVQYDVPHTLRRSRCCGHMRAARDRRRGGGHRAVGGMGAARPPCCAAPASGDCCATRARAARRLSSSTGTVCAARCARQPDRSLPRKPPCGAQCAAAAVHATLRCAGRAPFTRVSAQV
jgi:hypothetical protein